jgi:exonuclease III
MTDRPLTITSLNVKGLGKDSPKQKLIRTWIASLPKPPQILLLQEHHLDKLGVSNATKGIEFWQGKAFWNPGIPMAISQRTSAGTTILVDRATAPLISDSGILTEGTTQFVTLHLPDNSKITVINTYAPCIFRDRAPLWKKISEAEFSADHTILGGDFNHLEEEAGRGGACERRLHRKEAATWHNLTLQYGLINAWKLDSFRKMTKKAYTFDNGRMGVGSAVSRIDKILVSQELEARGRRIESAPSMRSISDHSPLILTIWGHSPAPPTPTLFFDLSLLMEEESRAALLAAWEGTEPQPSHDHEWSGWLGAAMDRVLRCSTCLTKEKRKAKGNRFRALQQKIRLAEIQLQSTPENELVSSILSEAQGHMADALQDQVARNQQLFASSWCEVTSRPSTPGSTR